MSHVRHISVSHFRRFSSVVIKRSVEGSGLVAMLDVWRTDRDSHTHSVCLQVSWLGLWMWSWTPVPGRPLTGSCCRLLIHRSTGILPVVSQLDWELWEFWDWPELDVCYAPLCLAGSSRKEITEHWDWLESNLLQTISMFDNDEDVTTFIKGKICVCHFLFCRTFLSCVSCQ